MTTSLQPGPARAICWGWAMLAVISLALAGVFAVLLVLSRLPVSSDAIPWPADFFGKSLVVHVVLSFIVWFLAVFGLLIQIAETGNGKPRGRAGGAGLALAVLGVLLLLIPAGLDRGEAMLNNYVPVIIDPLFYGGLFALAAGVLIPTAGLLIGIGRKGGGAVLEGSALFLSGLIFLAALAAFAAGAFQLRGVAVDHDFNERVFWGGGHILQFLNLGLLLISLQLLARTAFGRTLAGAAYANGALGILLILAITGLAFYGLFPIQQAGHLRAFTLLQFGMAAPVALFLFAAFIGRDQGGFGAGSAARGWDAGLARTSLIAATLVFALGALFGLFADGADTRTPAHYHGVIGGINLAFVGLFYVYFLPRLGRPPRPGRWIRWQIPVYAAGQSLFVIGMFIEGSLGAARKIAEVGIETDGLLSLAATSLRGIGGGLAVLGGIMFIVIALKALLREPVEV